MILAESKTSESKIALRAWMKLKAVLGREKWKNLWEEKEEKQKRTRLRGR